MSKSRVNQVKKEIEKVKIIKKSQCFSFPLKKQKKTAISTLLVRLGLG